MAIYDGDPRSALLNFVGNVYLISETAGKVKDFGVQIASEMAFEAALLAMGIEIRAGKRVSLESVGQAIGDKVKSDSGLDIGNVFDNGELLKSRIERAGIALFMQRQGIEGAASREGLAGALAGLIRARANALIESGADLSGVRVNQDVVAGLIAFTQKKDNPLKEGEIAEGNRRRQQTWRDSHRRVVA